MQKGTETTREKPCASRAVALVLSVAWAVPLSAQTIDRASEGWLIMTDPARGNCIACHALPGQPGQPSNFAPSLDKVGRRLDPALLEQWVSDARVIKSGTLMPPFGSIEGLNLPNPARVILDADQIRAVARALQGLQ
jgi:mono/diheme cytochrome c family protein